MNSSDDFVELRVGEVVLGDKEEVLWRQVHPQFVQDGQLTSQAFRPTEKDKGEASVTRDSLASAESSYRYWTEELALASDGSYGVTVSEVVGVGLRAVDDSGSDSRPEICPPGHAFIDYRHLASPNQIKKKSALLRGHAAKRPRAYPPPD